MWNIQWKSRISAKSSVTFFYDHQTQLEQTVKRADKRSLQKHKIWSHLFARLSKGWTGGSIFLRWCCPASDKEDRLCCTWSVCILQPFLTFDPWHHHEHIMFLLKTLKHILMNSVLTLLSDLKLLSTGIKPQLLKNYISQGPLGAVSLPKSQFSAWLHRFNWTKTSVSQFSSQIFPSLPLMFGGCNHGDICIFTGSHN